MGQVAEPTGTSKVPAAGSTERLAMSLHPYPACYSVPIKSAPLSGASTCPDAGSGHARFFWLGENPNGKVGQLLSGLHPKLYLHTTLINYANHLLGHDVGLAH